MCRPKRNSLHGCHLVMLTSWLSSRYAHCMAVISLCSLHGCHLVMLIAWLSSRYAHCIAIISLGSQMACRFSQKATFVSVSLVLNARGSHTRYRDTGAGEHGYGASCLHLVKLCKVCVKHKGGINGWV